MKISNDTKDVLKNFSTINSGGVEMKEYDVAIIGGG